MKLLWLTHIVPYPEVGKGVLQRTHNMVRQLAQRHDVHVLGLIQRKPLIDTRGTVERGLEEAYSVLSGMCREVKFLPMPCDGIPRGRDLLAFGSLFTTEPFSVNWFKSRALYEEAARWQQRNRFDLVHLDTISLAHYIDIFADSAVTLNHHNIESWMMFRRARLAGNLAMRAYCWQEAVKLARYERRYCPRADLQITCSRLDTDRLLEMIPGLDVVDIPNGVDTEYFTPGGGKPDRRQLIFAGNMLQYPNAAAMRFFATKVWPLLVQAHPDVVMNVIGANPPPEVVETAQRYENFRVHGFVDDVRPYFDNAAIYVCPIMDGGGTKLKVLDALAMRKPLVANPVACEGIDVVEGETVVFADRPEDWVARIGELLADEERCQRMAGAARALIDERYSYIGIGRKLSDVMVGCRERFVARRAVGDRKRA